MKEKLVKVKWDFITLKCGCGHHDDKGVPYYPHMKVEEGIEGAYYDCSKEFCINRIPLLAYEKILDEVVDLINEDKLVNGYSWKVRCARQSYALMVLNYKHKEKVIISIKNTTLRKRI